MAQIRWTQGALIEMEEIVRFIAADKPNAAELFRIKIFDLVDKLVLFPQLGRVVPEKEDVNLRELIYGNYRIIYLYYSDIVEILTIHHASRLLHLD